MWNRLGLSAETERVYLAMLERPDDGVAELCAHLGLEPEAVRAALDQLSGYALARCSPSRDGSVRVVGPRLAARILLDRQQALYTEQQRRLEQARTAASELLERYTEGDAGAADTGLRVLTGIDEIRDHLESLQADVEREVLAFAPGGPQTAENMAASRPLNRRLLERGVRMRTLYLDSLRNDPASVAHARQLLDLGAEVRTAPALPNRAIIVDGRCALVAADAADTAARALVVTSPGLVSVLVGLFETVWAAAVPLGELTRAEPGGLSRQEAQALVLLAQGRTDTAIANALGVSTRTARRITHGLLLRLEARSRFQAGVQAVRGGYLPS